MTTPSFLARPLYQSAHVRLTAVDIDNDPQVEEPWWLDLDYAQISSDSQAAPKSAVELKKYYREVMKEADEKRQSFVYAIRAVDDNALLGMLRIPDVIWVDGVAQLVISIPANSRGAAYLPEVLELALTYLFEELNLYRVSVELAEYDPALPVYEAAGFTREVTMRSYRYRNGRMWDVYLYGMLQREYFARQGGAA